jgi:hypothetical protein
MPLSLFDTTGTVVHSESCVPTDKWKKTTGTVVHLESHVPTEWEKMYLPIILLTNKDWNPPISRSVARQGLKPRIQGNTDDTFPYIWDDEATN